MKKLLLIILLFIGITGYSQNYLLQLRSDIIELRGTPELDEKAENQETNIVTFISYNTDTKLEGYYFDSADVCILYVIFDSYKTLNYYIKDLNASYVPEGDNLWSFHRRDYVYTAKLSGLDEDNFKIVFSFKRRDLKL